MTKGEFKLLLDVAQKQNRMSDIEFDFINKLKSVVVMDQNKLRRSLSTNIKKELLENPKI